MKHTGTITFETERLILRKFKPTDAEQMFKNYTSKDKVTEFLTWNPHKSVSETKEYLQNFVLPEYEKINTYRWAIVWKETNEVIGCIDVVNSNEKKFRAELGWVISDDFWGKGIMPEAAKIVIKHLFDVGYERIEAIHEIDNEKSGRVMQKVGMKYEGILRKYNINRNGKLVDCKIYAIIKTDEKDLTIANYSYLNKIVDVKMDRPLGSVHPKYGFIYPINYGYIPNTMSGDGEELDAYVLGEHEPLDSFQGRVIAIIHRLHDDDDKLVVVKDGKNYTDEQIRALTEFQEKYFSSIIIR